MAASEHERQAQDRRVRLVRSRRALVVVASAVNALALAAFLLEVGDLTVLDVWPLWLVLVAVPLSLTLVARFRLFRPVSVVLGLVSTGAGLVFSLVAPTSFLVVSGVTLAAAGLKAEARRSAPLAAAREPPAASRRRLIRALCVVLTLTAVLAAGLVLLAVLR